MPAPWGSVSIQVAFQNNPFDTSLTWTEIKEWSKGFTTSMGRQHELQQVNPSTATITLSNQDGRFSPWNTNSPYYYSGTGLIPGHPVRIIATNGGTEYPVFYGYVKGWIPAYGQFTSNMVLQCYDILALLNLNTLDVSTYSVVPAANASHYWAMADPIGTASAAPSAGSASLIPQYGTVTFGNAGPFLNATNTACVISAGVELAPSSTISISGTALTYELWVKTTVSAELLTNGDGSGLSVNAGNAYWNMSPFSAITGPAIDDGNWHYVVGTYDGAYGRLYVDGELAGSAAGTSSLSTVFEGVGVHIGTGRPSFSGTVAEVAVYPTALSASTIASQYAIGTAGFVVQDSGSRVSAVLNLAGVPSALNGVGAGVVQCQAASSSLATTTAMSYLNTVVNTERGLLYQDPSGVVQFRNRHYVYENSAANTSNATFGYASGQYHYFSTGLVPGEDDLDLWNNIPVQRTNGVIQTASDSASQTAYGRRTLTGYTNLLFETDNDSYDLATGLLYQYKQPAPRIRALSMDSTISDGANMPQMLGRKLLDRITVNWRPMDGSGVDFSQQSLIEQIAHTVTPEVWTTAFAVTPIGTENFARYDISTYGSGIYGF